MSKVQIELERYEAEWLLEEIEASYASYSESPEECWNSQAIANYVAIIDALQRACPEEGSGYE